jgi:hypothetical protein
VRIPNALRATHGLVPAKLPVFEIAYAETQRAGGIRPVKPRHPQDLSRTVEGVMFVVRCDLLYYVVVMLRAVVAMTRCSM